MSLDGTGSEIREASEACGRLVAQMRSLDQVGMGRCPRWSIRSKGVFLSTVGVGFSQPCMHLADIDSEGHVGCSARSGRASQRLGQLDFQLETGGSYFAIRDCGRARGVSMGAEREGRVADRPEWPQRSIRTWSRSLRQRTAEPTSSLIDED